MLEAIVLSAYTGLYSFRIKSEEDSTCTQTTSGENSVRLTVEKVMPRK
jgi:hypothetical protein